MVNCNININLLNLKKSIQNEGLTYMAGIKSKTLPLVDDCGKDLDFSPVIQVKPSFVEIFSDLKGQLL